MALGFVTFGAALIGLVGAGAAAVRSRRAARLYPPLGTLVNVPGGVVHAVQMGTGPDVVLIHGSMGSTRDMSYRLAPALVAEGFRVTLLDRPGLGHSTGGRAVQTVSGQVDRLAATCAELNLEKHIVVGQSYGGALAANWAFRHPQNVAAVVSISGATHPWKGPLDRSYLALSLPLVGAVLAVLVSGFLPTKRLHDMVEGVFEPDSMPTGYLEHFGPRLNLAPKRLWMNARQRTLLRSHLRAQAPRYGEISMPVEVVHGDADRTVGIDIHARPFAADVQNGSLTALPGVGHMPHHTATADVTAAVTRAALRAGLK